MKLVSVNIVLAFLCVIGGLSLLAKLLQGGLENIDDTESDEDGDDSDGTLEESSAKSDEISPKVTPVPFKNGINYELKKKIKKLKSLEGKVTNLFFLKLTRCGSTTLSNVLARFAWNYNLLVVTRQRVSWSEGESDVRYLMNSLNPPFHLGESDKYNMILDHSHYVPRVLKTILHEPTTFVSMIRNPRRRLFYHLNMEATRNDIKSFLDKLNTCSSCDVSLSEIKPEKYFWTRDWFGIPERKNVTEYLNKLDEVFFIGITEYYDESMILLRRKLGWELRDMIYFPVHVHNYTRTHLSDRLYNEYCAMRPDECEIYEHFNKTFRTLVDQQPENFSQEVMHYKTILQTVYDICTPAYSAMDAGIHISPSSRGKIEASEWNEPFDITYMDCVEMRLTDKSFRPLFFYKQNKDYDCNKSCNLEDIPQERCTQICQATRESRVMELYTNATLNAKSD